MSDKHLVGVVYVDTGRIEIGDPGYTGTASENEPATAASQCGEHGACVVAYTESRDGIFPVYVELDEAGCAEALTICLKRSETSIIPEQQEASDFWNAYNGAATAVESP